MKWVTRLLTSGRPLTDCSQFFWYYYDVTPATAQWLMIYRCFLVGRCHYRHQKLSCIHTHAAPLQTMPTTMQKVKHNHIIILAAINTQIERLTLRYGATKAPETCAAFPTITAAAIFTDTITPLNVKTQADGVEKRAEKWGHHYHTIVISLRCKQNCTYEQQPEINTQRGAECWVSYFAPHCKKGAEPCSKTIDKSSYH